MKRLDTTSSQNRSKILQSPHEERHIHTHEEVRQLNNSTITT